MLFFLQSNAQEVLWEYEYKTGNKNVPALFWLAANGDIYMNIKGANPKYKNQFDQTLSLLKLDTDGNYKGNIFINNCNKGSLILPFGENNFLATGFNCDGETTSSIKDTRLFDNKGKLLKKGKAFKGNKDATVPTKEGYSFFTSPLDNFKVSTFSIGSIDKNLEITERKINLISVKRGDLGIVNNYIDPVQCQTGLWVVPFNYGKKEHGSIDVTNGLILGIEESTIKWSYPDTLSSYKLKTVAAYQNTVAALFNKTISKKMIVLLDKDGKEQRNFTIRNRSTKSLELSAEHIIVINNHTIQWYDYYGELQNELDLTKHNLGRVRDTQVDDEGNVYISSNGNEGARITKIGFRNEDEQTELEKEEYSVESIDFDEVAEEAISVSVFPNPASIYINFAFEQAPKDTERYMLQVFSADGKMIHEGEMTSEQYTLNLFKLTSGTYLYRIIQKDNAKLIVSGRFIKVS